MRIKFGSNIVEVSHLHIKLNFKKKRIEVTYYTRPQQFKETLQEYNGSRRAIDLELKNDITRKEAEKLVSLIEVITLNRGTFNFDDVHSNPDVHLILNKGNK